MDKAEPKGVDPATLTECFAIYSRVQGGLTRYLRDDEDTYSPMMNKLREDGCKVESVINAFLAIQRYLSLRGLQDELFRYTSRVLFMVLSMEIHVGTADESNLPPPLPFLEDPKSSSYSAAFFNALSLPQHDWDTTNPKHIKDMMMSVLDAMLPLLDDDQTFDFNKALLAQVEVPVVPADAIKVAPNKTVH